MDREALPSLLRWNANCDFDLFTRMIFVPITKEDDLVRLATSKLHQ